ncbi:glycolipid 2-alpha-mannosyltransferase-domain-containing protein [Radiomyces spectabilis]|uniref:glycolipid 2-alpha-mannosyltransferase-domain-containing protein n=1 Tax=Radiomyces spectabilis TaxID=64574 RepID=UPI00221FB25C|nr:glycolipid 2-alpha-mannosyltransferase-domain-containing protein [Radiomyces spectabilis]KAI8374303.1 glycolipid 2-alpha-mannosyltransferase-domain-containing protein [Radiomyces spectabilis]
MFRRSKYCSSRWKFRIIAFLIVLLGGSWFLILRAGDRYSIGCSSSNECYQLLMSKAREIGQNGMEYLPAQLHSPKKPSNPAPINHVISNPVQQEAGLSPKNFIVTPTRSPEQEEYDLLTDVTAPRVKAAFVVLARNSEIRQLRSSMRYLEDRFNHKYNYPWIFLNDEPFTEEFKNLSKEMTQAETQYGLIAREHWSYPDWINQTYAAECRQKLVDNNVVYGGSESYRHMCRYQSGFFYMHPLLDGLDYYWRVEPGVKFSCDIDYDPFRFMQMHDLKYGFTIALEELEATVPTLWDETLRFFKAHPQYLYPRTRPDSLLNFVSDDNGRTYNLCHFWSNFEIASLKFLRSPGYQAYFRHLDDAGGFFYERWGDAPVHSLAVALMLGSKDVHWFYDIGYKHDTFEHCPSEPNWLLHGKCYCDPEFNFGKSFFSRPKIGYNATLRI